MERYKNLGGDSGVSAYEISTESKLFNSVLVQFIFIPSEVLVVQTLKK
jgi:hypothetical protein